jgi:cobalamin biosynthesis protein CobT
VQQSVDVAVPLETAYNQWTQFEDWPNFMHRVTRVTQEDDCTVSFATKIWGKTKEFNAKIETQRPEERIKWRVSQGITHTGVVTFHELAPRLTRIELTMDVDPGSLIEKAARGMRHVKRAARADLHRFKAFIEMQEMETGAWRGVIEDGELVEPHDDSYDEERDYSDIEDIVQQDEEASAEDEEQDESESEGENGNGGGRERTERFKRQAERTRGGREQAASRSSSSRSTGRSGGSSSSKGSSSGGSSSSRRSSSGNKSSSGSSGSRRKSSSRS